ncbi:unnamed protein product, partial [Allacma fusca]
PVEVYLNRTHLIEQDFDPEKPVKIVTHGYIDTGFSFWVIKLAQALLQAGDYNVIVVDWGGGSLPLYTQATANTRLVGLEIANYVQFLQREFQVKASDVHCIGHSLGAHVCGYAGEKVRDSMGECWSCGSDGSNCAMMGLDADKYHIGNRSLVMFYVSTAKVAPFCVRHYRVNLQFAWPQQAADWVQGKLKVSIIGEKSSMDVNLTPTDTSRFHHGTNLTFMVQNTKEMGTIEQIKIDWKYDHGYLDIMSTCWAYVCNSKLFVKKVEIMDIDDMDRARTDLYSIHLCGEEGTKYTGIPSGSYAIFERPC